MVSLVSKRSGNLGVMTIVAGERVDTAWSLTRTIFGENSAKTIDTNLRHETVQEVEARIAQLGTMTRGDGILSIMMTGGGTEVVTATETAIDTMRGDDGDQGASTWHFQYGSVYRIFCL